MGMFANTLFSLLLGWVQTAASWLWRLITNADVSAWFAWLLDNWLPLTILLCLAGAAVDFVVYLFRWQPYRVWTSFLRRVHRKEVDDPRDEGAVQPAFQRMWAYADGSTVVEDVPVLPEKTPEQTEPIQLEAPLRPNRRMARRASPEQSYNQPVYPPQWQHSIQDIQGENE